MLKLSYLPRFIICVGALCAMSSELSAQGIYDDGHGDIGVAYEAGELELHWHIEGGTVDGSARPDEEFEAEDITAVTDLVFFNAATGMDIGRPAGSDWDPIGNDAGDFFWFLPQTDNPGTPFIGLATEEMGLASEWSTDLTWEITAYSGPGEFSIWQSGVSPNFFASTSAGLLSFDTNVGIHDHYNYGFTELGTYDIQFTVSATHAADGFVSDTGTLSFLVVPEPSSLAVIASFGLAGLLRRRRQVL